METIVLKFIRRSGGPVSREELVVLNSMTKPQLSQVLKHLKQKFTGTKAEQIERVCGYLAQLHANRCNHMKADGVTRDISWRGCARWCQGYCKKCGMQIEQYERAKARDVLVIDSDRKDNEVNWTDLKTTEMVMDSACRRCVAGDRWHKAMRSWLAKRGLCPVKRAIDEDFRFGDDQTCHADVAWVYPAGVFGKHGMIEVAEVNLRTPPLLSRRALSDLC